MAVLGRNAADFKLSADRSREIPLSGLTLTAHTLHDVSLANRGGKAAELSTAATTVGGLLAEQGIKLTAKDRVSPLPNTTLSDGTMVSVYTLPTVAITSAGKTRNAITDATTVGALLAAQGIKLTAKNRISPALTTKLSEGLKIVVTTLPTVRFTDGPKNATSIISDKATVADLLKSQKVTLGKNDTVSPALSTKVSEGLKVTITRVNYLTTTATQAIAQPDGKTVYDDSMTKGTSSVTQDGQQGSQQITYKIKVINGVKGKPQEILRKTIAEALPTITHVGTLCGARREDDPEAQHELIVRIQLVQLRVLQQRCDASGE